MTYVAVVFAMASETVPDTVAGDLRVDAPPVGVVRLSAFAVALGAGNFLVVTFQTTRFVLSRLDRVGYGKVGGMAGRLVAVAVFTEVFGLGMALHTGIFIAKRVGAVVQHPLAAMRRRSSFFGMASRTFVGRSPPVVTTVTAFHCYKGFAFARPGADKTLVTVGTAKFPDLDMRLVWDDNITARRDAFPGFMARQADLVRRRGNETDRFLVLGFHPLDLGRVDSQIYPLQ